MTTDMSPTGDLLVTLIFSVGRCPLELAQGPSRVAPTLHLVGRSTPFGVTAKGEPSWAHSGKAGWATAKLKRIKLTV